MFKNKTFSVLAAGFLGGALMGGCVVDAGDAGDYEAVDSTQAPLLGADSKDAIPGQYIVVMKEGLSTQSMNTAMDAVRQGKGSEVLRSYTVIPGFAAKLDASTLETLRNDPGVAYIEQDQIVSLSAVQANARPGLDRIDQRNLPRNGTYDDRGFQGANVHVYVIDTGLRGDHTEFTGRVGAGATAINDGRGTSDCQGHGTHVASTVLGTVTGVAKKAIIHPIRVLDCNGSGATSGIIAGVDFVRTNGIRPAVANLSLGGGASTAMDNSITSLFNSGITPVVAAGNENQNACNVSPARAAAAITVGAVDDSDRRASFSNFGTCVDIFAPGVNVLGAGISSTTAGVLLSGTSMASPHVAGVAAEFLSKSPGATPAQVTSAIINAATTGKVLNAGTGSPNRLLFNGI
jgi:subtilisin family serine protease